MASVMVGSTLIIKHRFSVSQFWGDCRRHGATAAQYVGEMCRFLLTAPPSEDDAAHGLRVCYGIGMSKHVWAEFKERFRIPRIVELYGATEGAGAINNPRGKVTFVMKTPEEQTR